MSINQPLHYIREWVKSGKIEEIKATSDSLSYKDITLKLDEPTEFENSRISKYSLRQIWFLIQNKELNYNDYLLACNQNNVGSLLFTDKSYLLDWFSGKKESIPDATSNIRFRRLERTDFDKNFLQLLNQLAPVKDFSKDFFDRIFDEFAATPGKHVYVGEVDSKLICTGTLLVERKFFFNGSNFGHIEDIVVDEKCRGTGVGKRLMDVLIEDGVKSGCIRLVLDCVDDKKDFYIKCGFYRKGNQMNLEFGR